MSGTHGIPSVRGVMGIEDAQATLFRREDSGIMEDSVCWICLEAETAGQPLLQPCSCPRRVHKHCLARWQLQQAGRQEERCCRFCNTALPSWKDAFTPPDLAPAVPVMSIHFNSSTYWLQVHPGPDGLESFKRDVRRLLGLGHEQAFDISFECKVPGSAGCKMELRGLDAFDAAVYCASITAAERIKSKGALGGGRKDGERGGGGGGAAPTPPAAHIATSAPGAAASTQGQGGGGAVLVLGGAANAAGGRGAAGPAGLPPRHGRRAGAANGAAAAPPQRQQQQQQQQPQPQPQPPPPPAVAAAQAPPPPPPPPPRASAPRARKSTVWSRLMRPLRQLAIRVGDGREPPPRPRRSAGPPPA